MMRNASTAFVALGSNLGDRRQSLELALAALRAEPDVRVERVSTIHETLPVGGPPDQGLYLNAAVMLQTTLQPRELLKLLHTIEDRAGRVRTVPDGPRTLDLDLLLYENRLIDEPGLVVPHPRMHERLFVLGPLAEIAPKVCHPRLGQPMVALHKSLQGSSSGHRELASLRALVTGATSGIGRAIALELASAGAHVIVHGRDHERGMAVHDEVRSKGVEAALLLADLAQAHERDALAACAWQTWGGLDIWVNNAGADTLTGKAAAWSFEQKLQALLDVDVTATMLLSRDAAARMQAQGTGTVINIGWDQAETGMEGDSGQLFAASKAAVMAFTKSLARSVAPRVRVNCLAPGWIQTAWGETASDAWQERVLGETPLARWGQPEDVAKAACWLAGPDAAFITGQIIRVNGGVV